MMSGGHLSIGRVMQCLSLSREPGAVDRGDAGATVDIALGVAGGGRLTREGASDDVPQAVVTGRPPAIVYAGLDESGSLSGEFPYFCVSVVVTFDPLAVRHLIRRAASRSGKRLGRPAKNAAEIKWSNASQRVRALALAELAESDVEIFLLTVFKGGRKIEDTPENYGILACEVLSHVWHLYPNVALALDRHFTSAAQVAAVDTLIHRQWPSQGLLSVVHVDSQRNPLVQLADLVAGSVYLDFGQSLL